jgi:alpha-beta hydrolase superfamily lysophospholipase
MTERARESAKTAWERASNLEQVRRIRRELPIYILAGDADPVNQKLEALKPLAERYRTAGILDVSERYYPEGRHEMFNEINRDVVMQELLVWLRRIVPT